MTLAKVKEIIQLNLKEAGSKMPPDTRQALKIAIEAINRVEQCRPMDLYLNEILLPGETLE